MSRPELPDSVSIGPVVYNVETWVDLRSDDGEKILGEIDHADLEIKLHAHLKDRLQCVVLLHEVLHGIVYQTGRRDDIDDGMIDALAYGLTQLLHGDCDFFRYITEFHKHYCLCEE